MEVSGYRGSTVYMYICMYVRTSPKPLDDRSNVVNVLLATRTSARDWDEFSLMLLALNVRSTSVWFTSRLFRI